MAVCVESAGSVHKFHLYGSADFLRSCREAEAVGWLWRTQERRRERGIPKQLLIYTGSEYLAPVCKAFNGESSLLKDRFARFATCPVTQLIPDVFVAYSISDLMALGKIRLVN